MTWSASFGGLTARVLKVSERNKWGPGELREPAKEERAQRPWQGRTRTGIRAKLGRQLFLNFHLQPIWEEVMGKLMALQCQRSEGWRR